MKKAVLAEFEPFLTPLDCRKHAQRLLAVQQTNTQCTAADSETMVLELATLSSQDVQQKLIKSKRQKQAF